MGTKVSLHQTHTMVICTYACKAMAIAIPRKSKHILSINPYKPHELVRCIMIYLP